MIWLPSRLLEASNAILSIVLLLMLFGIVRYLSETLWLGFRWTYRNRMGAVALGVFLFGMFWVTMPKWLARFLANHGFEWAVFGEIAPAVLIIGTIVATLGGICWLRVTNYRRINEPNRRWIWLAVMAVLLGTALALKWDDVDTVLRFLSIR